MILPEIVSLFKNYQTAFDNFDGSVIAENYKIPCAITDADGCAVFDNRANLINKFTRNCEQLTSLGYQSSELKIGDVKALGDAATSVDIGWRVKLAQGEIEFRTLYLCHKSNQEWHIFNAQVYPGSFKAPICD